MKYPLNIMRPILIIFLLVNGCLIFFGKSLLAKGFDTDVLIWANIFLFCLHTLIFFFQRNALKNANPNAFTRSVMGGMMIKMFASVALILVYTLSSGENFNKKSVFLGMILYLVYLAAEVVSISRMNKVKNA